MTQHARTAVWLVPALLLLGGCPSPSPDTPLPDPLAEVEPNDDGVSAQPVDLNSSNTVRLTGTFSSKDDTDLFDLGAMAAGDRISVRVIAAGTTNDPALAVSYVNADRSIALLLAVNDNRYELTNGTGIAIDETCRRSADDYLLGVQPAFAVGVAGDAYDLVVTVERGGAVPATSRQPIVLDFDGGTITTRAGQTVTVGAFDPALIDPSYAGMGAVIRDAVVAVTRENFADFDVDIYSSDDPPDLPAGTFSSVFFGLLESGNPGSASDGLGMALDGVDAFNRDPGDCAVVFVSTFGPETFSLPEPLDAFSLATALANVGSHEAGHLLGLHHAYDSSDIMDTFDTPITRLFDQRFKQSIMDFSIFDPIGNFVRQDGRRLLQETVGGTVRRANQTLAVGATPTAIIASDVDLDGDSDLVVTNRFGGSVTVLRNDAIGLFAPVKIVLPTGPVAVIAADVNGDERPDLITAHPADQAVRLLRNDAGGQFTPVATYTVSSRPRALAAADFNGDGDLDIAVANYESNDIVVLSNDGHGNLTPGAPQAVGQSPQGIVAADFNGDSRPDLAVANTRSNDVTLLLNNGNFGFDASQISGGLLPTGLIAADLDGNGTSDLALADALSAVFAVQFASDVTVAAGAGDGTFGAGTGYFVGPIAEAVCAADFNGDGRLDLGVATSGDLFEAGDPGTISVLLNAGFGLFGQDRLVQVGSAPAGIAAADLNGDGRPDLAVVNRGSDNVSILLNDGQGAFGIPEPAGKVAPGFRELMDVLR